MEWLHLERVYVDCHVVSQDLMVDHGQSAEMVEWQHGR